MDGLEDEGFLSSVLGTNGSTFVDASLFFPQDDDWDEDDIDEIEAKKDPIYHIDVKVLLPYILFLSKVAHLNPSLISSLSLFLLSFHPSNRNIAEMYSNH